MLTLTEGALGGLRDRVAGRTPRLEATSRLPRAALTWVDRALARVTLDSPRLHAWLGTLDPTLSTSAVRARVVEVRDETRDTKTYVLRPNARWTRCRPGSFVTLRLTIGGARVERSYSISSDPTRGDLVAITVKRVPGGLVSNWLADHVGVGDVLEIGAPAGQFVLPEAIPERLLLLSAGSGITPVMAMLRHLTGANRAVDVAFVHFARSPEDVIFRHELDEVARAHANVRVVVAVESPGDRWTGARGRFTPERLDEAAADWRERPIYMCGPAPFMESVVRALEAADYDLARLAYERFSAATDVSRFATRASRVRFRRSGVESLVSRPRTVLEEAEAHGLRPTHGCRMGVCGSCRCRKLGGVVVDVTTGRASGDGDESILPCISVPRGAIDVEL